MIQTKNLLSTALILLSLATQFYSNAMLISKKQSALLAHRYQSKFHHDKLQHNDNSNNITSYNRERDKQIVSQIAAAHLPMLTSDVTPENKDEMTQRIMTILDNGTSTSKVYLLNGKPIGFINYYTKKPLILAQNLTIKSDAIIDYLAVDSAHHKQGIGSALLQHALDDLQQRSIHTITLTTTDYRLKEYYSKFGFISGRSSKYSPCTQFTKRLQPHPETLIYLAILNYFFKNKE